MTDNMNVRCWQLVDTRGTSFKFYNIYLAELHVITQWGRINSNGQTKVESFAVRGSATQAALKIHNEKIHKGYELVSKDFDLTVPRSVIANIVISGGSAATILKQPQRPKAAEPRAELPLFNAGALLSHHEQLIKVLTRLEEDIDAGLDVSDALDRWGAIDAAWSDLDALHRDADLRITTLRAMVTRAVMG